MEHTSFPCLFPYVTDRPAPCSDLCCSSRSQESCSTALDAPTRRIQSVPKYQSPSRFLKIFGTTQNCNPVNTYQVAVGSSTHARAVASQSIWTRSCGHHATASFDESKSHDRLCGQHVIVARGVQSAQHTSAPTPQSKCNGQAQRHEVPTRSQK